MGRCEQYCFLAEHNLFLLAVEFATQRREFDPEIYAAFRALGARVFALSTLDTATWPITDNTRTNRLSCGD